MPLTSTRSLMFVLVGGLGVSGRAHAAPPDADAEASVEASASTSTAARAEGRARSSRGDPNARWIDRWAPVRHMGELGVYGGAFLPSKRLELFGADENLPDQGRVTYPDAIPEMGFRAAYLPLRFFGVEAEGGFMPTRTVESGRAATLYTVRGHLLGQLGLWSVTPFILGGVGALGVDSSRDGAGQDVDLTLHAGGGVKFYLNRHVLLRLDGRAVFGNRVGVADGMTTNGEVLLGLSFVLGRDKTRGPKSKGDRDGDGITDEIDQCPDEPGPGPRGCPTVCVDDDDADDVPNVVDECPTEPESHNGYRDGDGCPDEVPEGLDEVSGIMEGIHFDTDSDAIRADSEDKLQRALAVLKKNEDIRVLISGHTDSRGGYEHNLDLSRRRAESVKNWLVSNGIAEDRLETRGVGPDEPIDTNSSAAGRFANRRIEFEVLDDAPRGKRKK